MTPRSDSERLAVATSLRDAVAASRGHFVYESGHHSDLWLDLEWLCVDAGRMQVWASALAADAAACHPEIVCGPLTGGAFLAQLIAVELAAGFVFAERDVSETGAARYRIPTSRRETLHGKRVLLVDDAVNVASAWRATRLR